MSISRRKFVLFFVISAFVFFFISNTLFGTQAEVFPDNGESYLGMDSPIAWKSLGYTILLPVKIVLIGPMLPFVHFIQREPDPLPPFIAAVFALYWSVLALLLYYLINKLRHS